MKKIAQKIIEYSFFLLFFLVPLIFYSGSYELFEYNKMMTTYALTVLIVSAWAIKLVSECGFAPKKWWFRVKKTPFDIPIALYLGSHILSTIFSIDPHISFWGYYSRFHEGLLASFSYILLFYAAVSNLDRSHVKKIFSVLFVSSLIVSIWGIMEHFGGSLSCYFITGQLNNTCWIQDVTNRVYATLGQPNWMAAFLCVSILVLIGSASDYLLTRSKEKPAALFTLMFHVTTLFVFFSAFLFTKSRSGFLAIIAGLVVFSGTLLLKSRFSKRVMMLIGGTAAILTICLALFGLPFPDLEKYSLEQVIRQPTTSNQQPVTAKPVSDGYIDIGISESSDIRRIVWQGAIKIWQRYPIFGSGVETYAYAYYQDRPVAHNMTSEWDFLYNKAHNEFLNVLATTGSVGMITYLLFIGSFCFWFIRKVLLPSHQQPPTTNQQPATSNQSASLLAGLFAAWITIQITNFFGFSVVIIGLFFFLIPAFSVILTSDPLSETSDNPPLPLKTWIAVILIFFIAFHFEIQLLNMWRADKAYALGKNLGSTQVQQYLPALSYLSEAVKLNPNEPTFRDELAYNESVLAGALYEKIAESTASGIVELSKEQKLALKFPEINLSPQELMNSAIENSNFAVEVSPHSLPFWKTRTKIFYQLASIDENFLARGLDAIQKASELAPTDAKVHYNLGLLLAQNGHIGEAIKIFKETGAMKPDYRDAFYALGLYYNQLGEKEKSREAMNYILTKIGLDAEAKKFLEENLR